MAHLAAVALLAFLSVANAERSLLAHKASGGTSLHGVAITGSGYYTTNGNGTWASLTNPAYQKQTFCYGSSISEPGPLTTYFQKGGSSVTDVHFPSRLMGIAVGAGCSASAAYTDSTTGAAVPAVPATVLTSNRIPQILLTFDMGATWQYATGFGTKPKSFAQTLQLSTSQPLSALIDASTVSFPSPDLTSVHCATRSLCFAAGGYFGSENALAAYNLGNKPQPSADYVAGKYQAVAVGTSIKINAQVMPVGGAVLVSTNGGTFWNYVTLPNAQPATTNAPPQPIPGLTDIASDASGRHVFAVGAPMFKNDYVYPGTVYFVTGGAAGAYVANSEPNSAGPGNPNLQSGAGVTSAVTSAAVGTIIYSGSYGATGSWALQTAPFIPNHWYSLTAVTVLRGSAALAVGGSPFGLSINAYNNSLLSAPTPGTYTTTAATPFLSSGVVLMTMNGGFRWMYQNLPSWSYWSQTWKAGAATGLYVYDLAQQADGMLPGLNDVACYQSTNAVTAVSAYSCFAVGDFGYMIRSDIPYSSLSTGVIASQNPTWSTVNVTKVAQTTGYLDFYGIAWDNNLVGYAFGDSFIVSTHDGGNTWVSETPNGIVTSNLLSSDVVAIATVPTTF